MTDEKRFLLAVIADINEIHYHPLLLAFKAKIESADKTDDNELCDILDDIIDIQEVFDNTLTVGEEEARIMLTQLNKLTEIQAAVLFCRVDILLKENQQLYEQLYDTHSN